MAQQQVKFEQFIAAPREKVFAYFADHEKFGRIWGGQFKRIKDSSNPRDVNGLGSVREIRSTGMVFEETISKYEPSSLIEYVVSKGGPIKNHLGHIEFHAVEGGTQVNYTISFDPRIPLTGGIIAGIICTSFNKGVHKAVREIVAA